MNWELIGSLTKLVVSGCRKLKASVPRVPTLKENEVALFGCFDNPA